MEFNLPKQADESLRIIPFGGCGYFGMNITAYLHKGEVYIVDAGSLFPSSYQSGVDCIVPNMEPVFPQLGNLRAYLITHGHEDHIGALPYLFKKNPAPIYAPEWACFLLEQKFRQHKLDRSAINKVKPGDVIRQGEFSCEWVHLNHSIPNACGLNIKTKKLSVFQSGDFKIEFNPPYEPPADLHRLKEIGDAGVDLLLADSTNANKPGLCPSENVTYDAFKPLIEDAQSTVLVATFSSNLWRMAILNRICKELGKKICLMGRGVLNTLDLSQKMAKTVLDKDVFVDEQRIQELDPKKLVIVATGCQGERFAALARIANEQHRNFKLKSEHTVIFSSRIIPGNEAEVLKIINKLERIGCDIVTSYDNPDVHVSGHGQEEDLSLLCQGLRPKNFLPVHGTFFHLKRNSKVYSKLFKTNIPFIPDSGDVYDLTTQGIELVDSVSAEHLFVDSFSRVPMTYPELKKRLNIGETGLVVFSGVYNKNDFSWKEKPKLSYFGVLLPESVDRNNWEQKLFNKILKDIESAKKGEASERTRIAIRNQLYYSLRKKPTVVANVHAV